MERRADAWQRLHDMAVALGASCHCAGKAAHSSRSAVARAGFDPDQPRDDHGRWTNDGGGENGAAPEQVAQEMLLPVRPIPEIPRIIWERIPRLSGKEGAKDIPSWARGQKPGPNDPSVDDWVTRLLNERYGKGNWEGKKGPTSDYSRLKKYGERNYRKKTQPGGAIDDDHRSNDDDNVA